MRDGNYELDKKKRIEEQEEKERKNAGRRVTIPHVEQTVRFVEDQDR